MLPEAAAVMLQLQPRSGVDGRPGDGKEAAPLFYLLFYLLYIYFFFV